MRAYWIAAFGADRAVAPDGDALADHGAGGDERATPDLRARPDDGTGLHHHAVLEDRIGMHRTAGARERTIGRRKAHRIRIGHGEIEAVGPVRLRRLQNCDALRDPVRMSRRADARAGTRALQPRPDIWILEEGQDTRTGEIERCRAA